MRNGYSDEVKAQVMAALLAGQAVSEIAKQYNIPEATIWSWKHRANGVHDLHDEKKQRIGELLLSFLEVNLETLRLQQIGICRDEGWLRKQSASEIAVLYGVTCDKTIRLLEALSRQEADTG